MTIAEAIDNYIAHLKQESAGTGLTCDRAFRPTLMAFANVHQPHGNVAELSAESIERWFATTTSTPYFARLRMRRDVERFFMWLLEHGYNHSRTAAYALRYYEGEAAGPTHLNLD